MLLAIDIGNTNIKFGLHDGTAWHRTWRVHTPDFTIKGTALPTHLFLMDDLSINAVDGVVIASVVPETTHVLVEL